MKKTKDITELFCKLVEIPSPSGMELAVATYIQAFLQKNNVVSCTDETGSHNKSNSGNVIAKVSGGSDLPFLLFVAHMDTVEVGDIAIKPVVRDGMIKSDGQTVLGADNKGSVAALLSALVEIAEWEVRPNVLALFTTREEAGEMGVSFFETSEKIDFAFCIDGAGAQGTFSHKALGQLPFKIEIFGTSSHSALAPEKGRNAISALSHVISQLSLGKLANNVYVNIGTISGGQSVNTVPDYASCEGEIRAYTNQAIQKKLQEIRAQVNDVCERFGCHYHLTECRNEGVPPMSVSKNSPIVALAYEATEKLRLPFKLVAAKFSCEANYLAQKYMTLNVSRGGLNQHTKIESITTEELTALKEMILNLCEAAAKHQGKYVT
jgi:tripeptide aminopeptidase